MKILILSINYWPETTGIGDFTTYRAEYLAAAGHEVTVCTSFPYYPEWRIPEQYAGKWALDEEHNGVKIVRGYLYVPRRLSSIKRILHEASFIVSATLRGLRQKRPDVLLVVSPPLGLAAPAMLLSRLWRVPYVFDVEDLQPDSAADLGMLPGWVVKILYRVEAAAYRHAGLVTTITQSMRKKILDKGFAEEKVTLIEPRMDGSLAGLRPGEASAFRQRYGLEEKFLVTYSGNLGVKQGLDVVIDAAALNRGDSSMLFLLVGNGADRQRIESRARELELPNVRFLPLLDREEFRGLMAASDLCLVTQQPAVSEIAFPSKIVTYLAAGKPIISSVNLESEVARLTVESEAGKAVMAGDPRALAEAVRQLRGADLRQLGENARQYACRRWSAERVLGHLEKILVATAARQPVRSVMEEGIGR